MAAPVVSVDPNPGTLAALAVVPPPATPAQAALPGAVSVVGGE